MIGSLEEIGVKKETAKVQKTPVAHRKVVGRRTRREESVLATQVTGRTPDSMIIPDVDITQISSENTPEENNACALGGRNDVVAVPVSAFAQGRQRRRNLGLSEGTRTHRL